MEWSRWLCLSKCGVELLYVSECGSVWSVVV